MSQRYSLKNRPYNKSVSENNCNFIKNLEGKLHVNFVEQNPQQHIYSYSDTLRCQHLYLK